MKKLIKKSKIKIVINTLKYVKFFSLNLIQITFGTKLLHLNKMSL